MILLYHYCAGLRKDYDAQITTNKLLLKQLIAVATPANGPMSLESITCWGRGIPEFDSSYSCQLKF